MLVKDFIIRNGGVVNIDICNDLIECCKTPHTRYQCYLSEQIKYQREEENMQDRKFFNKTSQRTSCYMNKMLSCQVLKARFHLFFGGKTMDRNGIGFTEKERISYKKPWSFLI